MTNAPLHAIEHAAELRTCLRDLVGLLGVPALWSTRDPQATVRMLAETLIETLSLDACFVAAPFEPDTAPLIVLFAQGAPVDSEQEPAWETFVEQEPGEPHAIRVTSELTPCGELRVARFSLGYYGHKGHVAAGSSRPDFPRPTEAVLLRAAASLAASGLKTARLAHERENALRAKDEFLAMLGHELRNPLAPIVAAVDLLKMKAGPTHSEELAIISRQVGHLTELVEDLLDVTRITTGKIELDKVLLDMRQVVSVALETARPLIEQRRHTLIYEQPAESIGVEGDERRLAQVVSNLLINAAKYTEPGGRIEVRLSRADGMARLCVADSGVGIDAALLPHVFDLFQQGATSVDRSRGGLGIGLTVVKSLIGLHGGSVNADSAGLGKGSRFTVTIPVAATIAQEDREKDMIRREQTQGAKRIVVVDDNQDAADTLGELLTLLGHEVHVRYGPLEALSLCEEISPDVVILDIGLPVLSGYELARLIRTRLTPVTPRLIALSGYGQKTDVARSHENGIGLHLAKPVSLDVLVAGLDAS